MAILQFRKRLEHSIQCHVYDRFTLRFPTNLFFRFLSLWMKNKSSFHFLCKREWLLSCLIWSVFDCLLQKRHQNCEKHKPVGDSLDDICCSKFQSYTLVQTTFEIPQFKMSCGTYDALWIISRLNTETVPSVLKRL